MAGVRGMLRRTLYDGGLYGPDMIVAMIGGLLVAAAFVVFLVNVLWTLGWANLVEVFRPARGAARPVAVEA